MSLNDVSSVNRICAWAAALLATSAAAWTASGARQPPPRDLPPEARPHGDTGNSDDDAVQPPGLATAPVPGISLPARPATYGSDFKMFGFVAVPGQSSQREGPDLLSPWSASFGLPGFTAGSAWMTGAEMEAGLMGGRKFVGSTALTTLWNNPILDQRRQLTSVLSGAISAGGSRLVPDVPDLPDPWSAPSESPIDWGAAQSRQPVLPRGAASSASDGQPPRFSILPWMNGNHPFPGLFGTSTGGTSTTSPPGWIMPSAHQRWDEPVIRQITQPGRASLIPDYRQLPGIPDGLRLLPAPASPRPLRPVDLRGVVAEPSDPR